MSSVAKYESISNQSTKNVEILIRYIRNLVVIIILRTLNILTLKLQKRLVIRISDIELFNPSAIFIFIYLNMQF